MRHALLVLTAAALGVAAAGCAPADQPQSQASSPAPNPCAKDTLRLFTPGKLTIGTDKPAFEPWFADDDPTNGRGFEGAVAYAVADRMGFTRAEVAWVTVPFNSSFAPGRKKFDFDVNQISITAARQKAVDFSTGYYTVAQAVVTLTSSPFANATTLAALKTARIGAQVGTTSLAAIQQGVQPTRQPSVFNDTNDAAQALRNKQVDAIVADLPTAFFLTAAEIPNSKIVGQFPTTGTPEEFGLLFEKGNPLVGCVNVALDALKSSGELARITDQWLKQSGNAPELT